MAAITRKTPTGKRYPRLIAAATLLAAIVATVVVFTRIGPFAAIIVPPVPSSLAASELLPAAPPAPELAASSVVPAAAPQGLGSGSGGGQHSAPRTAAPVTHTAEPTAAPTPKPMPKPTPAPTATAPPGGDD